MTLRKFILNEVEKIHPASDLPLTKLLNSMENKSMKDKKTEHFYKILMSFFKSTNKTSWGKNELMDKLKDLYIEFLSDGHFTE